MAAALSPLEIERQITRPVEGSISGLPGLVEVRSVSKFGFSQVTVTFNDETDIYLARQVVLERVQSVEIPPGLGRDVFMATLRERIEGATNRLVAAAHEREQK